MSLRDRLFGKAGDGNGKPHIDTVIPCTAQEAFDLLGSRRRRHVLDILADRTEPIDLRFLSECVAMIEEGALDVEEIDSYDRRRVYISLYQTNVPKLEAAGLIEWDKDRDAIRASTDLSSLVEVAREVEGLTREPEGESA